MAIFRITCPECDKVFKPSVEPPPGKKVRCPACKHAFLAVTDEDEADDGDEGRPGKALAKKTDAGRKSRKKRQHDEDDDDEDEVDDEEDLRGKKKKKKKTNVVYLVYRVASIVALLILLGILAAVLLIPRRAALKDESVLQLDAGDIKTRTIDAAPKTQTITFFATATSGQFNIYVFLEKDNAEATRNITLGKLGSSILAHQLKATEAELSATVPANEGVTVMVTSVGGKNAEVKLKITN